MKTVWLIILYSHHLPAQEDKQITFENVKIWSFIRYELLAQVLPYFVINKLGHLKGLPGLFTACVYGAALRYNLNLNVLGGGRGGDSARLSLGRGHVWVELFLGSRLLRGFHFVSYSGFLLTWKPAIQDSQIQRTMCREVNSSNLNQNSETAKQLPAGIEIRVILQYAWLYFVRSVWSLKDLKV